MTEDAFRRIFEPSRSLSLGEERRRGILLEIARLERLARNLRMTGYGLTLAIAAFCFSPVFSLFSSELADSGFAYYAALLFTDGDAVLAHAGDAMLSLLEAMPLASITALLGLVFFVLGSLRFLDVRSKRIAEIAITRFA